MSMPGMGSTSQPSMMGGGGGMNMAGMSPQPTMMSMGGGGSMPSMSGMNMDDDDMGMAKMEGMKAYFFTGEGFHMLLKETNIRTNTERAWATVVAFLFGMLVPLVAYCVCRCKAGEKSRSPLWRAVATGALTTVNTFFHYIAMLMAMTMNVYVFAGVVVGHGFGAAVASLLQGRDERRVAAESGGVEEVSKQVSTTSVADEGHC